MKLISALVAAFAMCFSMVLMPSTATAATNVSTAYPGTVATTCNIAAIRVARHHRIPVSMHVTAGNAEPTGRLFMRLFKKRASGAFKLVRNPVVLDPGGVVHFRFKHVRHGIYKVRYIYSAANASSVFESCTSPLRRVRVTR
jgi:hypothetical protein